VWRWLLGGLAVVVVAVVVLVASGGSDDSAGHHSGGTDDAVEADLAALQRFADSGGGTRASGTPGDRATGAYLAERLKKAGYRVTIDPFTVPFYEERRPPRVAIDGKRLRGIRTLFGNPTATPADAAWPLQHPVIAAVFWSIAFLAVAAPLTIWLFKKRTTE